MNDEERRTLLLIFSVFCGITASLACLEIVQFILEGLWPHREIAAWIMLFLIATVVLQREGRKSLKALIKILPNQFLDEIWAIVLKHIRNNYCRAEEPHGIPITDTPYGAYAPQTDIQQPQEQVQ
jgi:hypothetical protein